MKTRLAEDANIRRLVSSLSDEPWLEAALLVGSRLCEGQLSEGVDYDVAMLFGESVSLEQQVECIANLSGRHKYADFFDLRRLHDVNIGLQKAQVILDRGEGRWREVLYQCWKLRDELESTRRQWIVEPTNHNATLRPLSQAVVSLRELSRRSRHEVEQDPFLSAAALHLLQTAGHHAYDFSSRVASSRRLGLPLEHGAAFGQLARTGLLCANLADRMQSWLGLRDLIIHHSHQVDWEMIWEVLTNDLPDLEEFLSWAHRLIDTTEKELLKNEKG